MTVIWHRCQCLECFDLLDSYGLAHVPGRLDFRPHVEEIAKDDDDGYSVNTYIVCGIEPYIYGCTRGREDIAA